MPISLYRYVILETPIGKLLAIADAKGLLVLTPIEAGELPKLPKGAVLDAQGFAPLAAAIKNYLAGKSALPKWPVGNLLGTPFQKKVWATIRRIPYGQSRSYGEVACLIESPRAARAVGSACGKNPILLFTPCHRVLAAQGALGGYSGRLDLKRKLLAIEGVFPK